MRKIGAELCRFSLRCGITTQTVPQRSARGGATRELRWRLSFPGWAGSAAREARTQDRAGDQRATRETVRLLHFPTRGLYSQVPALFTWTYHSSA